MNPALSVILFTTLSGTGFGLLSWLGLNAALHERAMPRTSLMLGLGIGAALVVAGLIASLWHLGRPRRAWRAFSQWRSSWLSREAVLAVLTFVPLIVLMTAVAIDLRGPVPRVAGGMLALCSLGTVACTAMIYASLAPIAAWRDDAVIPVFFGYALLGGFLATALLIAALGVAPRPRDAAPITVLAGLLVWLKLGYWRRTDSAAPASDATGLAALGRVRSLDPPNTEPNFLQREMGFVFARRHVRALRAFALWSGLALPGVFAVAAAAWPPAATLLLAVAMFGFQVGVFVERWLFFAQARHTVMQYYPEQAA